MTNQILKSTILETVENQLQMNEPKCTRLNFERLVDSGYTENETKEMIAAVLLENMYYVFEGQAEI